MSSEFVSYAVQYSDAAKKSRKELPRETQLALFDVLDKLAENPDAFPGRTQPISRDGRIRVYTHPSPALQITFEVDEEKRVLYLLHFVAPQVQVTKPVFISYSHEDAVWLIKLRKFLRPLEDQGMLHVWVDTEIKPGSVWMDEIRQSLESARVAVFLITQNFLDSEFIREKELPQLLVSTQDRGCLVFWIAVSASTVDDSAIAKFQAANDPACPLDTLSEPDQNRVLKQIYDRMKQAVQVV
jgi:mRNA-degrading endonuclease RelE of RelBE toxin-antitoxin system